MRSNWLSIAVLVLAAALWAQLALIPTVMASSGDRATDALVLLAQALALGVAVLGLLLARRRPATATGLVLAGYPATLGLLAVLTQGRPLVRFDAPARVIAAATALGFVAAAVAWAESLSPAVAVTVRPLEGPAPGGRAPPLRRLAPAAVTLGAAFVALVAPALVTARPALTRAERLGGEELLRGREAITAAGGLAIAALLVLGAGSDLVRQRSLPRRRTTRALAYLVWGVAVAGLKILLDQLR